MKCPTCTSTDLLMTERQGVEIDYCPACRGVWLDRGELDKILERSAQESAPSGLRGTARQFGSQSDAHQFGNSQRGDDCHHDRQYRHTKKPFWQELFD
jgi:Zn-finger nucleic acid-binding protein